MNKSNDNKGDVPTVEMSDVGGPPAPYPSVGAAADGVEGGGGEGGGSRMSKSKKPGGGVATAVPEVMPGVGPRLSEPYHGNMPLPSATVQGQHYAQPPTADHPHFTYHVPPAKPHAQPVPSSSLSPSPAPSGSFGGASGGLEPADPARPGESTSSTHTTVNPDGSRTVRTVTRTRQADGSIVEDVVTSTGPQGGGYNEQQYTQQFHQQGYQQQGYQEQDPPPYMMPPAYDQQGQQQQQQQYPPPPGSNVGSSSGGGGGGGGSTIASGSTGHPGVNVVYPPASVASHVTAPGPVPAPAALSHIPSPNDQNGNGGGNGGGSKPAGCLSNKKNRTITIVAALVIVLTGVGAGLGIAFGGSGGGDGGSGGGTANIGGGDDFDIGEGGGGAMTSPVPTSPTTEVQKQPSICALRTDGQEICAAIPGVGFTLCGDNDDFATECRFWLVPDDGGEHRCCDLCEFCPSGCSTPVKYDCSNVVGTFPPTNCGICD